MPEANKPEQPIEQGIVIKKTKTKQDQMRIIFILAGNDIMILTIIKKVSQNTIK